MLREQFADESKASPILGQGGLLIFLDLHNFLSCAPDHQNVRRIAVLRPFMVVFESEWLLLPRVGMRCGQQDLKCFEFVLGFRVARAAVYDIRDFALHTGFRAAHWLTHSPQLIEPYRFARFLEGDENQVAATRFFKRRQHTISKADQGSYSYSLYRIMQSYNRKYATGEISCQHKKDNDILQKDTMPHMPDIYEQVGKQIRELRTALRGRGISQEELAQAVKTTANTISRWETATYKPSISDLERLAQFFGVPITIVLSPSSTEITRECASQRDGGPG